MKAQKQRLVFLDLLRGWAVLVMIEVHVFNAFLLPELREQAWFDVLNYVNGLVAPSFIFISGFVFMVAADRKLAEFRTYGRTFWKQLFRIGLVWVVGYFLHLPFFSLQRTLSEATEAQWLKFFQADVLHCIAFGLLILFLLRLVIQDVRRYKAVVLGLAFLFTLGAPLLWDFDFNTVIHPGFAAYMNGQHFSQFPLFPWLGFMMGGGYLAAGFLESRAAQRDEGWFRTILIVGLISIAAGAVIRQLPVTLPGFSTNIRSNPFFVLERLGIVLVLLVCCRMWERRYRTERSFVLDAGRESLVVYTVHLLVIYGQFWDDRSLSFLIGKTWNVLECAVGTFALVAVMIAAARTWIWLKREHPPMARLGFAAVSFVAIVGFLIR